MHLQLQFDNSCDGAKAVSALALSLDNIVGEESGNLFNGQIL